MLDRESSWQGVFSPYSLFRPTLSAVAYEVASTLEVYLCELKQISQLTTPTLYHIPLQTFTIHIKNSNFHDAVAYLNIDGTEQTGVVVYANTTSKWEGPMLNSNTLRPSMFAPLSTSDDDALLNTVAFATAAEHLGTIVVKPTLVKLLGEGTPVRNEVERMLSRAGPVHERCKKVGIHRVGCVEIVCCC